eukprot:127787_1
MHNVYAESKIPEMEFPEISEEILLDDTMERLRLLPIIQLGEKVENINDPQIRSQLSVNDLPPLKEWKKKWNEAKGGFRQYKFKCELCGTEYQSQAWFIKHKCKTPSKKKTANARNTVIKVSELKTANARTETSNNESKQNIDGPNDNRRIIDAIELVEMKKACTDHTMDSKYKLLARSQITLTQLLDRRELYHYSNTPYSITLKTYDDVRNWKECPLINIQT